MTAALTRSYEKTVQFRVGHRTAAVSMKQTSVAAADNSSTSGRTRRSYVDRSWQSWYVGSEDHSESLIVADDYVCRPTAGRTSMTGMHGGAICCWFILFLCRSFQHWLLKRWRFDQVLSRKIKEVHHYRAINNL